MNITRERGTDDSTLLGGVERLRSTSSSASTAARSSHSPGVSVRGALAATFQGHVIDSIYILDLCVYYCWSSAFQAWPNLHGRDGETGKSLCALPPPKHSSVHKTQERMVWNAMRGRTCKSKSLSRNGEFR